MNYRQINRSAWYHLSKNGCTSSQAYSPEQFSHAEEILDPEDWIPWNEVHTVLCLASGGGQQAPLFASLGLKVVSVDLCLEQLRKDQSVARRQHLEIDCVQADMLDLSCLYGRRFDLVYQAVSACYVPDVYGVYCEVAKVLRPGGLYRVEHWNPLHLQLAEIAPWSGQAYQIARPQQRGVPIWWRSTGPEAPACVHFIHTLGDLLGGLCDAGFAIVAFGDDRYDAEAGAGPGSDAHLACFIPPFLSVLARKSSTKRTE